MTGGYLLYDRNVRSSVGSKGNNVNGPKIHGQIVREGNKELLCQLKAAGEKWEETREKISCQTCLLMLAGKHPGPKQSPDYYIRTHQLRPTRVDT